MAINKANSITLDVTDRCQLRCETCLKWKTNAEEVLPKELSTDQWKHVLKDIRDWCGENTHFIFSGGEPFLRKDIIELIRYANSIGLNPHSMSNAFSIEPLLEEIAHSGLLSINFSLNSIQDPSIHDKSRGVSGAYDKVISVISKLKKIIEEENVPLKINLSTIMFPENIDEIIPLVKFVEQQKLNSISIQLVEDVNSFHGYNEMRSVEFDAYSMPQQLQDTYNQIGEKGITVINQLIEMKKAGNSRIENSIEILEAMKLMLIDPREIVRTIPCVVGENNIAVDPYGDVRLCFNMSPVGNVQEGTLSALFNGQNAKICREKIGSCNRHCRILGCNFKKEDTNQQKNIVRRIYNKVFK